MKQMISGLMAMLLVFTAAAQPKRVIIPLLPEGVPEGRGSCIKH